MNNENKFNIGDSVICINDNFVKTCELVRHVKHWPIQLEIYTIEDLHEDCIFLEEIANPDIIHEGHNYGQPMFL